MLFGTQKKVKKKIFLLKKKKKNLELDFEFQLKLHLSYFCRISHSIAKNKFKNIIMNVLNLKLIMSGGLINIMNATFFSITIHLKLFFKTFR